MIAKTGAGNPDGRQPAMPKPGRPTNLATRQFSRNFLDDIEIEFGPSEQLGRMFLQADTAARSRGITLSFVSLEELVDINARNSDSWRPLVPLFHPQIGGVTQDNAFCMVARNSKGEAVATTAVRLYTWLDTTLKTEAESLRLFYADPASSKLPGEACSVTAPSAATMAGRCAFSGAVWYRPDHRKLGLHDILGRVVKGVAHTRWYIDTVFTFMAPAQVEQKFAARSGYHQVEWDVVLESSPWGTARLALIWSSTEQLLTQYLFEASRTLDPQVDVDVVDRAADQLRRA